MDCQLFLVLFSSFNCSSVLNIKKQNSMIYLWDKLKALL
ncbi:hypothetical protein [Acinetobacter gyllenbergii]